MWNKTTPPILKDTDKVDGPGHNSITKAPNNVDDIFVLFFFVFFVFFVCPIITPMLQVHYIKVFTKLIVL
jgi:hypothetical protein